jgi:hypothetical protein
MRISHHHKFIFFAYPRTASRSARLYLDSLSDIKGVNKSMLDQVNHGFYSHITASETKTLFEQQGWDFDSYLKFTFIRNPYDRMVSLYCLNQQGNTVGSQRQNSQGCQPKETCSFDEYIRKSTRDPKSMAMTIQRFAFDESGNQLVDHILRFEDFDHEIRQFLTTHSIPISHEKVPYVGQSVRSDYRQYYTPASRAHVAEVYAYEIERFGYTF